MKESEIFDLNSFTKKDDKFHLARTTINSATDLKLHKHNYAEIFWIKDGKGIHCINGTEVEIVPGYICMIRPNDNHTFKPLSSTKGITITNFAFEASDLDWLKQRYFDNVNSFFWLDEKLPYNTILNKTRLNELSSISDWIMAHSKDNLHLDSLLIFIFRMLTEHEEDKSLPHWLSYSLENFSTPEYFTKGTKGFLELSGKSLDHVNRILKQHLNQTLTETINKARMSYAANQLVMTNATIKWICDNCGFNNISHFDKLFKKHYGIAPSEYRKLNHKIF